jgi:hypothetical protein
VADVGTSANTNFLYLKIKKSLQVQVKLHNKCKNNRTTPCDSNVLNRLIL